MELEEQIRSLRERGDLRAAATAAVEGYGPEVFGFLVGMLHDERDASEVFSQTCEDLWTGLPSFGGRCSTRTWLYTLARHAATRFCRSPHRDPGRHVALSEVTEMAVRARSLTPEHIRTGTKDRWALIRESLEEDDRALLMLRVDRSMSWREIALVFDPDANTEDAVHRTEARLRKRFQLVKDEIRKRARQQGHTPSVEP